MSGLSGMPYPMRKRLYATANRMVRARNVDPAIVRKYDMLKADADRWLDYRESGDGSEGAKQHEHGLVSQGSAS